MAVATADGSKGEGCARIMKLVADVSSSRRRAVVPPAYDMHMHMCMYMCICIRICICVLVEKKSCRITLDGFNDGCVYVYVYVVPPSMASMMDAACDVEPAASSV